MTFFFSFFFNTDLLFPIFIWTFLSHLYLDFSFPFPFGLFFPFSIWTFISLFYMDAPIFSFLLKFFSFLFKFFQFVSIRSIRFNSFYTLSRSHFGFLPNFFNLIFLRGGFLPKFCLIAIHLTLRLLTCMTYDPESKTYPGNCYAGVKFSWWDQTIFRFKM